MADHSEVAYTTADGNDYKEHEQTYLMFLTLTKWGIDHRRGDPDPDGLFPGLTA